MRKILIVEDELVVRSIYRRKFEMSGFQVATAEEGASALKMLPEFKPDLIQLDLAMPGMDGVEVIRQIRGWPEFRKVPILVVSSFYRPDLAKEAWKAGATKCVSKMDCTPNLALELVEQLLSGEDTGFTPKFGTIPLAKGALDDVPLTQTQKASAADMARLTLNLDLPPSKNVISPSMPPSPTDPPPPWPEESPTSFLPRIKGDLNLPPSKGTSPTRPTFATQKDNPAPTAPCSSEVDATTSEPDEPAFFWQNCAGSFQAGHIPFIGQLKA
jgi:CheY-like chemotaxis protein